MSMDISSCGTEYLFCNLLTMLEAAEGGRASIGWPDQPSAIQGSTILVCFGETSLDGRRALVLSDVGRVTLCDNASLQRDRDEMEKAIDDAFWALAKFGVGYGDIKLDNFHLVNGTGGDNRKIINPRRGPERPNVYSAEHLFRLWREAVESDRRQREEELRRRHAVLPNAEESRRLEELTRAYHLAKPPNPVNQLSS